MKKLLLQLYRPISMVTGLGALGLMCLLWYPFALLLGLLPLSPYTQRRIGRGTIHFGMRIYMWILRYLCIIRVDAKSLYAMKDTPAAVLVANHPSLLDAVIFLGHLPNVVCVMKAALQKNILYGAATRLSHFVSNKSPLEMINAASEELRLGGHLLIFPESTRTVQWPVNPCGSASGMIAKRAQVPLQSFFIEMSSPYLGKNWPLFKPPELPLDIRVVMGPRIPCEETTGSQVAHAFEAHVRAHFADKPPLKV